MAMRISECGMKTQNNRKSESRKKTKRDVEKLGR
jgi:hypothetical protein